MKKEKTVNTYLSAALIYIQWLSAQPKVYTSVMRAFKNFSR